MKNKLKKRTTTLTKTSNPIKGMRRFIPFDKRKISSIPEFDFKTYDEELKILQFLCENLSKEKTESQALKNYIVIRLVGIVENQFKSIISDLVDFFEIPPSDILDSETLNIRVDELDIIQSKNVTKGKIVTMNFRTQNANDLNKVLSRINQLEFFDWSQSLLYFSDHELNKLNKGELFSYINNIFLLRNDIVHNLKNVENDIDWLKSAIKNLNGFCRFTWKLSAINLSYEDDNDRQELIKNELNVSITDFNQITKESHDKYFKKILQVIVLLNILFKNEFYGDKIEKKM